MLPVKAWRSVVCSRKYGELGRLLIAPCSFGNMIDGEDDVMAMVPWKGQDTA